MRYWNFSFIVSELVQVNPDNSRAMSALTCNYNSSGNTTEQIFVSLASYIQLIYRVDWSCKNTNKTKT